MDFILNTKLLPQSSHRVAIATFWHTFHHDGKIRPASVMFILPLLLLLYVLVVSSCYCCWCPYWMLLPSLLFVLAVLLLMTSMMMLSSLLLLLSSLSLTSFLLLLSSILCWRSCYHFHSCFCLHSCCCERSWYCCHPPLLLALLLLLACHCCCLHPNCGRYSCCCLHPNCGRYSCCYWRPFSSWWVTLAGLPAIAGIPGVARVSEVPVELAVAGGPAVICFPAVDGILTVASIPGDPRVPILAGGFTYWTVQWDILLDYRTIGQWLSDCYFLLLSDHRNIEYRIGEFKKLSDYRISDLGLNLSDYRISDSEKTIGCPPLADTLPLFLIYRYTYVLSGCYRNYLLLICNL